jgi:hypothetical protein
MLPLCASANLAWLDVFIIVLIVVFVILLADEAPPA